MRGQKRWNFGEIEIVPWDFALRASEITDFTRIEKVHQLTILFERWLGDPRYRASVLAIEREFTLTAPPTLGRPGGRENDRAIIAGLRSAFEARKFHALLTTGRISAGALTAYGRSWRFEGAEVIESNFALRVGTLADYYLITDAANFARALNGWLRDPRDRRAVLDMYEATAPSSARDFLRPDDPSQDKRIVDELVTLWQDRRLYFLQHRIVGGIGGDEVSGIDPVAAIPPPAKGRQSSSPAKTWIEIVLVDETGKPVPGVKYQLKITDGSLREGTLGADGSVRVNGIDPGTCTVSFPQIDAREWSRA
jgi:hypothetical protein